MLVSSTSAVAEDGRPDPLEAMSDVVGDLASELGVDLDDPAALQRAVDDSLADVDARLAATPDDPLLLAAREQLVEAAARGGLQTELAASSADELGIASSDAASRESSFAPAALTATAPITMDPPGTFAGPISFEQPWAVITGRSLRMSELDAGSSFYGLHIEDMVVADVSGDGRDDVVAFGFGRIDRSLPDERHDAFVMVARADGFGGFEAGTAYPIGVGFNEAMSSVGGLDVGDVDNDTDIDIVVGLQARRTVLALLNDGNGAFPQEERTPVAEQPDGTLIVEELTDDEFLDVAATSRDGDLTMILRGNGNGTFAPATDLVAPDPETVAAIELGGATSLVTSRYAGDSAAMQLWTRGESGTWSATTIQASRPGQPTDIVDLHADGAWIGDVDGDGDEDLVAAARSGGRSGAINACELGGSSAVTCVRVLLNDGAGGLVATPESFSLETGRYRSNNYVKDLNLRGEMYDLDGDGNLDVVAPGQRGGVNVIFGDGAGGFGAPVTWNGLPNITPPGGWTDDENALGHFMTTVAVAVTDVTGDGVGDVIAATDVTSEAKNAGTSHSTVAVVPATDERVLASAVVTPVLPGDDWDRNEGKERTHLVDWNDDGLDDLVILGRADDPATPAVTTVSALVMRPGMLGGFGPVEWIGAIPLQCLQGTYLAASAIADIDDDGALDVSCGDTRLYVAFGDGSGGLEPAIDLGLLDIASTSTDAHEIDIVDLDGDGLDDVVYVTRRGSNVAGEPDLRLGNLIIGWSRQTTTAGGEPSMAPVAIAHESIPATSTQSGVWFQARPVIADVTGDGRVDVAIIGNDVDDRFLVFRNDSALGAPAFVRVAQVAVFADDPDVQDRFYDDLTGLDADGDGDTDLIATDLLPSGNFGPQRWVNVLLRNNGTGTFAAEELSGGNGQPRPVAIDIDGDGNTDLAWPTSFRGVEVRRGSDDGSFAPPVTFPVADRAVNWLGFRDVDDDGLPDIVAGRDLSGVVGDVYPTLVVALNTSTGLVGAPDLVVDAVDVSPTPSATTSDIGVTIANLGWSTIDDPFTTSLWLSVDDVWGVDDVLLGEVDHSQNLPPTGTSTATLTTDLIPLVDGEQFVVARTDPRRQIVEADEANNTGSTPVDLSIPELVVDGGSLGVTPAGATPGLARVGASAVPVRIEVSAAADVVTAAAPDRVPNETSGVVTLVGPGAFVLPAHSGDSYLRVDGAGAVTLTAIALPFGVGRVSPRVVGNTGDATLLVAGVALDDSMTVELVRGTTRIAATSVTQTAGGLTATMPMSGAALGSYDLTVTSGGDSSTLADAVSVQLASLPIGDGDVNQLMLSTFVPSRVRSGPSYDYIITFANRALTDIVAPFLEVTVEGPTPVPGSPFDDFSEPFFIVPEVVGAPAGVLPPGSTGRLRIPFNPSSQYGFGVEVYSAQTDLPYDWEQRLAGDPPDFLTQTEYEIVLDELATSVGTTSGSYVTEAQRVRAELLAEGVRIDDLGVLRDVMVDRIVDRLPGSFLRGIVTTSSGDPAAGVVVTATEGERELTATTRYDGSFSFRDTGEFGPTTGDWDIAVEGHGPAPLETVTAGTPGAIAIDAELPAWTPVSGVVTDEMSGDPVEQAVVTVRDTTTGQTATTLTAADGTYALGGISPGTHEIFALKDLLASAVGELVVPGGGVAQTVDLAVATAGSIVGTVVDPDGVIVDDASVLARTPTGDLTATTTADGAFTFDAVVPGVTSLLVTAPAWAGRAVDVDVVAGVPVDAGAIALLRPATVVGTVTDADDTPIAGATIGAGSEVTPTTESGADGTFELRNVPAGANAIVASADGFLDSTETIELVAGTSTTVDIALATGFTVEVSVTADGLVPVQGAVVRLGTAEASDIGPVRTATAADGRVVFESVAPETYVVSVGAAVAEVTVGTADVTVALTAPAGHAVNGRVVDAVSDPVENAYVAVFDAASGPLSDSNLLTEIATLPDGTFAFTANAGAALELVVSDPAVGLRRIDVAGAADGAFTDVGDVGPAGSTVTAIADWPGLDETATATLNLPGLGDQEIGVESLNVGTVVDEFDFGTVADGDYVLRYRGETVEFATEVTVSGTGDLTISRPPTANLSGTAVDDDDVPLADALIMAWTGDGLQTAETVSDAAGAWNLGGVPVGNWFVAVTHPELGVLSLEEVVVGGPAGLRTPLPLQASTPPIPRALVPSSRRSFVPAQLTPGNPDDLPCVVDPDVRLPAIGRVTSELVSGGWDGKATTVYYRVAGQSGFIGSVQATDPIGEFRTPDLPDGNYEIVVRAEGHVATQPIAFSVPGFVLGGDRCRPELGDIVRGESVTAPPDSPRRSRAPNGSRRSSTAHSTRNCRHGWRWSSSATSSRRRRPRSARLRRRVSPLRPAIRRLRRRTRRRRHHARRRRPRAPRRSRRRATPTMARTREIRALRSS